MFLNICEQSGFLSIILFIKTIINYIQIIVPIALIIMCTIDLVKQVLNPDIKKATNLVKRAIAAVLVFFIPTFVNLLLDTLGETKFSATSCWSNANSTTIAAISAKEKAEEEAAKKAREEDRERKRKEAEEQRKALEELKKQEQESANLLHETTKDGLVDVVDGVFYKPSGAQPADNSAKGSGPYGYHIVFYNRLQKMIDDAAKEGYTIRMSTSQDGAWRPYDRQAYFYCCYTYGKKCSSYCNPPCNSGNPAAVPGYSNHGWGIASDLKFGSTNAMYWAHDNASKYGLNFSMCKNVRNGPCSENWHIQAANIKNK